MSAIVSGLFEYTDTLSSQVINSLPDPLKLDKLNEEALLIRLLTGNISVCRIGKPQAKFLSRNNYMVLPTERYALDWLH